MTVPGKGGRPLKFNSVEELQQKIDDYFVWCDSQVKGILTERGVKIIKKPYTMSGLAIHLGCDRKTLVNYSKNEEYFHAIKAARQRVEGYIEEGMLSGELSAVPCIFNMKNNFGWADKQEIDLKAEVSTEISFDDLKAKFKELAGE